MPEKAADISDVEDDPDKKLERIIPAHDLLDSTVVKHKTNLIQRRIPPQNKPNMERLSLRQDEFDKLLMTLLSQTSKVC